MKKKIKFGVISPFWPFGGVSNHIKNLYPRIAKDNRFEITLFTNYQNKDEKKELQALLKKIKLKFIYTPRKRYLRGIFYTLSLYFNNFKNFDIVKIHNTTYAILLLPKILSGNIKNFIIQTHGRDVNELLNNKFYRFFAKIAYKQADCIMCPSFNEKNSLIKCGIDADKIKVIRDGIDVEKFSTKKQEYLRKELEIKNKYIIISIGHISKTKGIHILLKAVPDVMKKDTAIILVGSMSLGGADLIEEIKKLEKIYAGRLFWLGERKDIQKILASSDIFLLPSLSEASTSFALLEAMASGKACIATDVGDIKELLRDCCILVKPGNSNEITKAIDSLIKNPKKIKELGRKAREKMKFFSWKKIVKEHICFYERIIK